MKGRHQSSYHYFGEILYMPKPVTPLVGCDVFVLNEKHEVLLIKRADNGLWALPGGCHDLGETPQECAERECKEESGYLVKVTDLLGVYSSNRYEYINYPWKENEFCHLLFKAELFGGRAEISFESTQIGWFSEENLPALSDGHDARISFGFKSSRELSIKPYFE
jgi:ADP-ribose pyrophosphatase YjhB (NUDIX family)